MGYYEVKRTWDNLINNPPEFYLDKIKNNEYFAFSRFGDGEVLAMFIEYETNKGHTRNCDGSDFSLEGLGAELRAIFKNNYPYYKCLINCSFDIFGDKFLNLLKECGVQEMYWGEGWQDLSFSGNIGTILDALKTKKLLYVGGEHMLHFKELKGMEETEVKNVVVPQTDCYLQTDKILTEILLHIEDGIDCVCFSAGYATKVWIDHLYPLVKDKCFLIDFGSVFDPYCGKLSRSGMRSAGFNHFQPYTNYQLC